MSGFAVCDRADEDEPLGRCGRHHPADGNLPLFPERPLCCCESFWDPANERCGSGAYWGEADKVYLECLKSYHQALEADLKALRAELGRVRGSAMTTYRLSLFPDGDPEQDQIGDPVNASFLPHPGMILFHGKYRCEVVRVEIAIGQSTVADVIVKAEPK